MQLFQRTYRLFWLWAIVFLLLLGSDTVVSQSNNLKPPDTNVRTLDQAEWEDLQENLDYSKKEEEKPKEEEKEEKKEEERERWDWPDWGDWSPFAKILAITILVGLLSWVVLQIIINYQSDDSLPDADLKLEEKDTATTLQRIEEELDRTEVVPLRQRTEQEGDYVLAVRLYYLEVLKRLNELKHIRWKKDYTNRVYLNALRGKPHFETFRKLTRTFERVWYGNKTPDPAAYQQIKQQYEDFLALLNQEKPPVDE